MLKLGKSNLTWIILSLYLSVADSVLQIHFFVTNNSKIITLQVIYFTWKEIIALSVVDDTPVTFSQLLNIVDDTLMVFLFIQWFPIKWHPMNSWSDTPDLLSGKLIATMRRRCICTIHSSSMTALQTAIFTPHSLGMQERQMTPSLLLN